MRWFDWVLVAGIPLYVAGAVFVYIKWAYRGVGE